MSKFLHVLGYVWASPLTLLGLLYVLPMSLLGWYKLDGVYGTALVWTLVLSRSPTWLVKRWSGWNGHTVGNVVVMSIEPTSSRGRITLLHEAEHVKQCMILGVLFPLLYALFSTTIRIACSRSDPYFSNPFEVSARRVAGQVVDFEGTLQRLQEKLRSHDDRS